MDVTMEPGSMPSAHPSVPPDRSRHLLYRQSAKLWQHAPLASVGAEKVARGLGWFSIGLGLAQLVAPRAVAAMCGLGGSPTGLIRMCGLREIASGVLIIGRGGKPAAGMWSRVAGDAMDLATLAGAAALPRTDKRALAITTATVLGVTALDVLCAQELSRKDGTMTEDGALRVTRSITIRRRPDEIYQFWRDVENFPRFMTHLQSVRATGADTSHWVASAPGGTTVEWDAVLTADRPGELIAWRSLEGAEVENAGTVRFEPRPGQRGTIVRVEMEYRPPGGIAGAALAMLFGQSPQQQLYDDLHRLKQVLETGEVVRSDGSPAGTGAVLQQPARPAGQVASAQPSHDNLATRERG